mmetsp:Transcript_15713/g.46370  ORF Transcript_15713/g.46370 Transcript_15713/m.46370 type:complete len:241 (+) Transcript_15713:230-952(+)
MQARPCMCDHAPMLPAWVRERERGQRGGKREEEGARGCMMFPFAFGKGSSTTECFSAVERIGRPTQLSTIVCKSCSAERPPSRPAAWQTVSLFLAMAACSAPLSQRKTHRRGCSAREPQAHGFALVAQDRCCHLTLTKGNSRPAPLTAPSQPRWTWTWMGYPKRASGGGEKEQRGTIPPPGPPGAALDACRFATFAFVATRSMRLRNCLRCPGSAALVAVLGEGVGTQRCRRPQPPRFRK